ncbi:hypothetical protein SH611_20935 [Geminicoccaceae bacterium 1502E]|nr:hypothetical protein [Geminicoccaceae bacterium 1502E]
MPSHTSRNSRPAAEFEDVVKKILSRALALRFDEPKRSQRIGAIGITLDRRRVGVEIKIYSSLRPPMRLIASGVAQLATEVSNSGFSAGLLIVTTTIPHDIADRLTSGTSVSILDLDWLVHHASSDPSMYETLWSALRHLDIPQSPLIVEETQEKRPSPESAIRTAPPQRVPAPPDKGGRLADKLSTLSCGKSSYTIVSGKRVRIDRQFENLMYEAINYLFDKDLTDFARQRKSHSGISYYDAVARISSDNSFWKDLSRDFSSRYVVFEFKNYCTKVGQYDIYQAEKYLYKNAVRSVAIIVSRKGADKNAFSASLGALREHGKLIVNITLEVICQMLRDRDGGDDPNRRLSAIVDDMLIGIER